MKYLQIDGKYIDCPDPKAHLLSMLQEKKLAYTDYVMYDQFITYGLRKVVNHEHRTIFQMSEEPIRPKPRTKHTEEAVI